ncbi:NAD(P)/FAD-dependent oxidoreductase [Microbulbifer sp. THAF38]|uniref:NAD(P)/FAD-dependent oxidoreductase n=1 Tax=Microbulbifer sp. THAF38 TaxID=2587856 RepID=UPI00126804B2|nr:NAD(P)/FAD-dependent oxidoreductase [Microbulbifer sp. THAF38]QFT55685.1 NADH dehydrogenase [Microbulbifer sp. THAF38]
MKKIVIIGGGASGLHLATRLGRYFNSTRMLGLKHEGPSAQITLVDKNRTHIWKPLIYQVAVGTLDTSMDALNYQVHASSNGYEFQLGSLQSLDRKRQILTLGAVLNDKGCELIPPRELEYDYLVLCVGSISDDSNIQGVREHCIPLDSIEQAHNFHKHLLDHLLCLEAYPNKTLQIAIIGGGCTGVELAAELVMASRQVGQYGRICTGAIDITLVEAEPQLLPGLPARLGNSAERELCKMGVRVLTNSHIISVSTNSLTTDDGREIPAAIRAWVTRVKAPEFLTRLDGLVTNQLNQIEVKTTLQSKNDPHVFAMGDCASCIDGNKQRVPLRALAAQQMAKLCSTNLIALIENKSLGHFYYRDRGSLVSLSTNTAVGNLRTAFVRRNLTIEGRIASLAYHSLYQMHLATIHGWPKAILLYLLSQANRAVNPRLKLH